jgi:hypothetical protein
MMNKNEGKEKKEYVDEMEMLKTIPCFHVDDQFLGWVFVFVVAFVH